MPLQRPTTGVCHALLRIPTQSGPFCTMWFRQFTKNVTKTGHTERSHPHSTEHDTQPIAYLISKQAVSYWTRGGTCCLGGGGLLLRFDLSRFEHDKPHHLMESKPSPPFQPCSNHNIDPHQGQFTSWRMGDHLSQRHKPNSTSQRMKRLVWLSWLHG
jgi:hypothetical protein